ncbi:MAG: polysaccharide biosynthesis tyrosine autokinase [Muribaculaceae bacterium]|nr:polysaccharide biosynthesis tyrosine autokinase [Muribaculaceae bacterium]
MDNNSKNKNTTEEIVNFDIKDFLRICLNKWYWFAICASFAVGIALFYIYRKQPEYKRYEQILVNDQDSGGGIGEVSSAFSSLGLFSKNTNVYNELLTMTSPAVLYEVADSLQLDMNYAERDGLRYKTLYGTNQPFRIDMLDIDPQGGASFKIKKEPDGSMNFFKFRLITPDGIVKYDDDIAVPAGTTMVPTPIGMVKISPNPKYIPDGKNETKILNISKMAMQNTVELYGLKLNGDLADEDADIIELSIEDVSTQRAVDILNYVLMIYNQNWIDDKNRMANATSKFIEERLDIIQHELTEVDNSIAAYKKEKGIPDVQVQLQTSMELGSKMEEDLMQASNELSIAKYMKDFLVKNHDINTVLPANLGVRTGELSTQITAYNELLLNRNTIANSSSDTNPLVMSYDRQLRQMRTAIEASVNNSIANLQEQVAYMTSQVDEMNATMSSAPATYLPLLTEERQQQVKQELYLFLLQKKEENELTQKFTSDNIKIITPPVGPLKPVSPKKGLIIIVALIIGFGVPFIVLYYLETSNNTVRNKKDLESMSISFVGEIPQVGNKANLKELKSRLPRGKIKDDRSPLVVVGEGKQDIDNEAFRLIRGNVDFLSGKNRDHQVIMFTSFNPGSGKSFVAYNLAMSYALKGKKVLIVDCDLRKGSISMLGGSPKEGITSYLTNDVDKWENLVKSTSNTNLYVLPVGQIPPNPAELLDNERMVKLIEAAKSEYDLVFLDCPPVNIVVDTQILAPLANRTLFVIRAGMLEKPALKELNEYYEEKKYPNIGMILNGTDKNRI